MLRTMRVSTVRASVLAVLVHSLSSVITAFVPKNEAVATRRGPCCWRQKLSKYDSDPQGTRTRRRNETESFGRNSRPLPLFVSKALEKDYVDTELSSEKTLASIQNAVQSAQCIFDLYAEETADRLLSPDLAMVTLQGVVIQSMDLLLELDSTQDQESVLDQLHALVWRMVKDLDMVPPRLVLQTLCRVAVSASFGHASRSFDRVGRLLIGWYEWSAYHHLQFGLSPPPPECLEQLLALLLRQRQEQEPGIQLSPLVYKLYQAAHAQDGKLSRSMYEQFLALLQQQGVVGAWETRVLQDMTVDSTVDTAYRPTLAELKGALERAAAGGLILESSWILRQMELLEHVDTERVFDLFFQALLQSRHEGSLLYMQRLLGQQDWASRRRARMLLEKCTLQQAPGKQIP